MNPLYQIPVPTSASQHYLLNGTAQKSSSSSKPASGSKDRTSINARERNSLTASIRSSHTGRQPIDLDVGNELRTNGNVPYQSAVDDEEDIIPTELDVSARDLRDEAPRPSRPATSRSDVPYTLNPPIDYDGLSWPSE